MNLYQEMIIDHSRDPRGWDDNPQGDCAEGHNPMCGDQIKICVDMEDGVIKKVRFKGHGCSLSVAAASVLSEISVGWSYDVFCENMAQYLSMLKDRPYEDLPTKLKVFSEVGKYPMRVKCVTFAWHALKEAMQPLCLSDSIKGYWMELVEEKNALGIEIGFKQTGCFGWQYVSSILFEEKVGATCYQYGSLNIYIQDDVVSKVQGTKVDYIQEDLGQSKVLYQHPNIQERCGCGESFVIEEVV